MRIGYLMFFCIVSFIQNANADYQSLKEIDKNLNIIDDNIKTVESNVTKLTQAIAELNTQLLYFNNIFEDLKLKKSEMIQKSEKNTQNLNQVNKLISNEQKLIDIDKKSLEQLENQIVLIKKQLNDRNTNLMTLENNKNIIQEQSNDFKNILSEIGTYATNTAKTNKELTSQLKSYQDLLKLQNKELNKWNTEKSNHHLIKEKLKQLVNTN